MRAFHRFVSFADKYVSCFPFARTLGCFWAATAMAASGQTITTLGLRVSPGFVIRAYAEPSFAPSPQAIAVDANGRLVVTGPGYIRTLFDDDADGVADRFVGLAGVTPGGLALNIDGAEILVAQANGLVSYLDNNADGVAEGRPNWYLEYPRTDYGVHGIRRGPDGWWYMAGGIESGFRVPNPGWGLPKHEFPQAGVVLRWSSGNQNPEVIAHGFLNPHALEFSHMGDLFVVDTDDPADYFLPNYAPARLFHMEYGGHHGWLTVDPDRKVSRPGYLPHGTQSVYDLDRALPTALVAYRHRLFPEYFQNGFFVADWWQGRVHFVATAPLGATYQSSWEPFVEGDGAAPFTPTDIAVMPDGALMIAAGGNRVPGGLFRVDYVGDPSASWMATNWLQWAGNELNSVLRAPQPLDAWSRVNWSNAALSLTFAELAQVVLDVDAPLEDRIRAIEILTDLRGGLGEALARSASLSDRPEIRARTAWSVGRIPCPGCLPILLGLVRDEDAYVRVSALDALDRLAEELNMTSLQQALGVNLAYPDLRVRSVAIRLASHLTEPAWNALWALLKKSTPLARLTGAAISLQRPNCPPVNVPAVEEALGVLSQTKEASLQLEAIQLVLAGLGSLPVPVAPGQSFAPEVYRAGVTLAEFQELTEKVGRTANALFPNGSEMMNREVTRLLAVLEYHNATLPERLLARFQPSSLASSDMHYLAVLSRLPSASLTNHAPALAQAFLSVSGKIPGEAALEHLHWGEWHKAILKVLQEKVTEFPVELLVHPAFASPGHERWVFDLNSDYHVAAARRFLERVQKSDRFPWSPELVQVLSVLPPSEVLPLLRRHWDQPELRNALLLPLAKNPVAEDRDKFVWGLESEDPDVVGASLSALVQLPGDSRGESMVGPLRLLRRLLREPGRKPWRVQIVELLKRYPDFPFARIQEPALEVSRLESAYAPVFDWFLQKSPALLARLDALDGENPKVWESKFTALQLKQGNSVRGAVIYQERGCAGCHTGDSHLGPDLGGIGLRLADRDIFNEIVFPNRHVASDYRMTVVELKNRTVFAGAVAKESFGTVFLQLDAERALKLPRGTIRAQYRDRRSMMPPGLLSGLDAQALADLSAFLKTLPVRAE